MCCCTPELKQEWTKFIEKQPEIIGTILVKRVVSSYESSPRFYLFDAQEDCERFYPVTKVWKDYVDGQYNTNHWFMRNDDFVHYEWMRLK